jgi:hypothetical protein
VFLFFLSLLKLKERDMKVNVTVKGELTGGIVQQYELDIAPADVLATFEESRKVWDEFHVEFKSEDPIAPFELYCVKTYKQEMMDRQWLLDLHEEVAGEE